MAFRLALQSTLQTVFMMNLNLVALPHFLAAYLSADQNADFAWALRTFSVKEPESFDRLRSELRMLLSATTDLGQVREIFLGQGLYLLPQENALIHQALREMYAYSQMTINDNSNPKPYDVFVSYASPDRPIASRLTKELSERGYVVWLDAWELLAGHNIAEEVYKGITGSQFAVILLSPHSCESKWVREELTAALMAEIEARQVVVLPVKIGECEIPFQLRDRRYVDFTASWEGGLQELVAAMDLERIKMQLFAHSDDSSKWRPTSLGFNPLGLWRGDLLSDIEASGFIEGSSFKDTLIGPIDGSELNIDVTRLQPIVDASRVWMRRWGGPPFPYGKFPSTQEYKLEDGLRYVDIHPWPYRSRSFHFWQIDSRLHFLHRSLIDEDFCQTESGDRYIANRLVRSWALIDIVSPLLFARNLLIHEPGVRAMGVSFVWRGLKGRSLLELSPNRMGFIQNYPAQVQEWRFEIGIDRDSDIVTEARRAALDLFLHFGWQPRDTAALDSDLKSLADRSVPI